MYVAAVLLYLVDARIMYSICMFLYAYTSLYDVTFSHTQKRSPCISETT